MSFSQSFDYNYDSELGGHTGDPNLDSDYSRQHHKMPDLVKKFLIYFRNSVNEGLIFELQTLYEQTWPKLTEDYFEKRPWPEESEVGAVVDNDPVSISFSNYLY